MIIFKLIFYAIIGCLSLCMLALGGYMFAEIPVMDDDASREPEENAPAKPIEMPHEPEQLRERLLQRLDR